MRNSFLRFCLVCWLGFFTYRAVSFSCSNKQRFGRDRIIIAASSTNQNSALPQPIPSSNQRDYRTWISKDKNTGWRSHTARISEQGAVKRKFCFTDCNIRVWNDFLYGAQHVNSRYLELFLEYGIQKPLVFVTPVFLLLSVSQLLSPSTGDILFSSLETILTAVFVVASAISAILLLPLLAIQWGFHSTSTLLLPSLDYLPNPLALTLVRISLFLQHEWKLLSQTATYAGLTIFLLRPLLEEIQYRYILNHLIGKSRIRNDSLQNDDLLVEFIPLEDESSKAKRTASDEENLSRESSPELFLEGEKSDLEKEKSSYEVLADESSRRLLLSSLAFSATRLGWFCASAGNTALFSFGFLHRAISPYIWTVGFVQSATTHFSSHVLSEVNPMLQRGLMLLALQLTIASFFISKHVFGPLYQERGLAASIGAHLAWTAGKVTIPVRLLMKLHPMRSPQPVGILERDPSP